MLVKSPTANATKYVDINGVVANLTIFVPSPVFCSFTTCIFDNAVSSGLTSMEISNLFCRFRVERKQIIQQIMKTDLAL